MAYFFEHTFDGIFIDNKRNYFEGISVWSQNINTVQLYLLVYNIFLGFIVTLESFTVVVEEWCTYKHKCNTSIYINVNIYIYHNLNHFRYKEIKYIKEHSSFYKKIVI